MMPDGKKMRLPERIRGMTGDEMCEADGIGLSDSSVFLYQDKVLKIQEKTEEAENEYRMLLYLRGKTCVPRILARESAEDRVYLLYNYSGKYEQGKKRAYPDFDKTALFRELGIEPEWDKIRYYLLLDALI